MKFLKTYEEVKFPANSAGNEFEITYVQRYKDDGTPYLQESGVQNNVEKIKSYKDICNYEKLIRRYEMTGDSTILMRSSGVYADMADMPEDLISAYDMISRAEKVFDKLPVETKREYGNSLSKFLADFGSENWLKAFGIDTVVGSSEEAIEKKDEVKENAE